MRRQICYRRALDPSPKVEHFQIQAKAVLSLIIQRERDLCLGSVLGSHQGPPASLPGGEIPTLETKQRECWKERVPAVNKRLWFASTRSTFQLQGLCFVVSSFFLFRVSSCTRRSLSLWCWQWKVSRVQRAIKRMLKRKRVIHPPPGSVPLHYLWAWKEVDMSLMDNSRKKDPDQQSLPHVHTPFLSKKRDVR